MQTFIEKFRDGGFYAETIKNKVTKLVWLKLPLQMTFLLISNNNNFAMYMVVIFKSDVEGNYSF